MFSKAALGAGSYSARVAFKCCLDEKTSRTYHWRQSYIPKIHSSIPPCETTRIKDFVIPTKSFVKIGIAKIFCHNNKMFTSINKTFGCCSKIFGCSNKKKYLLVCCRNKTIFPRENVASFR